MIESTPENQVVECSCGAIKIAGGHTMVRQLKGGNNLEPLVEYEPIQVSQEGVEEHEPMQDQ